MNVEKQEEKHTVTIKDILGWKVHMPLVHYDIFQQYEREGRIYVNEQTKESILLFSGKVEENDEEKNIQSMTLVETLSSIKKQLLVDIQEKEQNLAQSILQNNQRHID
ncbi:MAG: hypothetical protein Sylvanvirus1_22 [Sylvanvirus sp.]|uniref:Uncharacterized protein n=1 Tax=Sylvanvirus sp. TaxID=2487774 RepID=A0A3G5AGS5_9VIRU|nr:MAG: hypothetical protein Sylvanvirus1_22 [Sylvanvirus sp.]